MKNGNTAMCMTDVKNYFGSIDLPILGDHLLSLGCDRPAVELFLRWVEHWQVWCNLRGIPIGPEASALVGNAFLLPIDERIRAIVAQHVRYMDDIVIPAESPEILRALLVPLDEKLFALQLERAKAKTRFFVTPEEAIVAIEDELLASAFGWFSIDDEIAISRIYEIFDSLNEDDEERKPARFRAAVKTLANRSDPYAASSLATDWALANIDPRVSGDYLATVGLNDSVVAGMCAKLSVQPHDRYDALDLHFLRAFCGRAFGAAEGNTFLAVGMEKRRRPPVRCWALRAAARTPAWKQHETCDAAEVERDPGVRRALVGTLRAGRDIRSRRLFLRHICRLDSSLSHTARWVQGGEL